MKKALSVTLITGSIITAICGVLVLVTELILLQTLDFGAVASFLIGILLIGSPAFTVLLIKQRTIGGIMILLSALLFVVYLFAIQTDGLTVDPAVLTGVCIVQAVMCILTISHWMARNTQA